MRLCFAGYTLDRATRQLLRDKQELHLEPKAFDLLELLVIRRPEAVSKVDIRGRLWPDTFVSEANLTGLVAQVRQALADDPKLPRFVRTVHGFGYAFAEQAYEESSAVGTDAATLARRPPRRLLISAIVGLGLAACLMAAHWLRSPTPTRSGALTVVPFTTFAGRETAPTFSPDGSQIAFAWSPEGTEDQFDLYVKVIGTEQPLRLTHHPSEVLVPAWSPDGRLIAFSRTTKDGEGIYAVPALGGPERRLTTVSYFPFPLQFLLSWSPDGKTLALFDSDEPPSTIGEGGGVSLLDLATLKKQKLARPSACQMAWAPVFSPDGRSLAVACMLTWSVHELLVLPLPNGAARKVALVHGELAGLAWAEDGQSIIFAADGTLWRISASGGAPEKLLSGRNVSLFALSPGTHRLAYTEELKNANIWRVRLATATRSTESPEKLISSSRAQNTPSFSPDGRRLTFESTRSGATEIWTSEADGSGAEPLTSFGGPLTGSPKWSPDGREIAFDSRASGHSDIYVAGVEGGPPEPIVTGVRESALPSWSTDGRSLYFCSDVEDGTSQVWTIPRDGGSARAITKGGGYLPQASMDGKRVYYLREVSAHMEVWSAAVDGTDEIPVSGMPRLNRRFFGAWTVTRSGIYFVDGETPRPGIAFFDFATRRIDRVFEAPGRFQRGSAGLAVSPRGDILLFSQRDTITGDIMLVENFRD